MVASSDLAIWEHVMEVLEDGAGKVFLVSFCLLCSRFDIEKRMLSASSSAEVLSPIAT